MHRRQYTCVLIWPCVDQQCAYKVNNYAIYKDYESVSEYLELWFTKCCFQCLFKNSNLMYNNKLKILIILALVMNCNNNRFTLCATNKCILFIKKKVINYKHWRCYVCSDILITVMLGLELFIIRSQQHIKEVAKLYPRILVSNLWQKCNSHSVMVVAEIEME